jgi:hypothetical protein
MLPTAGGGSFLRNEKVSALSPNVRRRDRLGSRPEDVLGKTQKSAGADHVHEPNLKAAHGNKCCDRGEGNVCIERAVPWPKGILGEVNAKVEDYSNDGCSD